MPDGLARYRRFRQRTQSDIDASLKVQQRLVGVAVAVATDDSPNGTRSSSTSSSSGSASTNHNHNHNSTKECPNQKVRRSSGDSNSARTPVWIRIVSPAGFLTVLTVLSALLLALSHRILLGTDLGLNLDMDRYNRDSSLGPPVTFHFPRSTLSSSSSSSSPPPFRYSRVVLPDKSKPLRVPMANDLGRLDLTSLRHVTNDKDFIRRIHPDDAKVLHRERRDLLEDTDADISETYEHTPELQQPQKCARNNWAWTAKSACNNFHETPFPYHYHYYQNEQQNEQQAPGLLAHGYNASYINSGHYRETFLFQSQHTHLLAQAQAQTRNAAFVYKTLRMYHDFDYYSLSKAVKEAVAMEALSSSAHIVDIYGYCGTSLQAEALTEFKSTLVPERGQDDYDYGRIEQRDLDKLQRKDVYPLNNLTLAEKLDYALQMSLAVAELHGFPAGLILHGDLHPKQYLKAADGKIKLNDFGNSVFLNWSLEKQAYCPHWSHYSGGYVCACVCCTVSRH